MSGGDYNPALAALVTQVPSEASPQVGQHAPTNSSSFTRLCSCVFGQRPNPGPKLASVLPGEDSSKVGRTSSALSSRQQHQGVQQQQQRRQQQQQQQQQQQRDPEQHAVPSRECVWGPNGDEPPQLGPQVGDNIGRKTLVLDLDETLVHSSFRATSSADIVITVELEGEQHRVYVRKRPGVDEFLVQVARMYEVVVYTASMAKYANPLLDELDKSNTVCFRLFREACTRHSNGYAKDLSRLGRDLKNVIIIDNSPVCYALQPDNAIPIRTWRDDERDLELLDLIPILCSLANVEDIPVVLRQIVWTPDE